VFLRWRLNWSNGSSVSRLLALAAVYPDPEGIVIVVPGLKVSVNI
jgi:hypothetical protein